MLLYHIQIKCILKQQYNIKKTQINSLMLYIDNAYPFSVGFSLFFFVWFLVLDYTLLILYIILSLLMQTILIHVNSLFRLLVM